MNHFSISCGSIHLNRLSFNYVKKNKLQKKEVGGKSTYVQFLKADQATKIKKYQLLSAQFADQSKLTIKFRQFEVVLFLIFLNDMEPPEKLLIIET